MRRYTVGGSQVDLDSARLATPEFSSGGYFYFAVQERDKQVWSGPYATKELCAAAVEYFKKAQIGGNMFKELTGGLKKYVNEHQEMIYTIAIALLIDRFVFGGAFQERIKGIVEGFLSKAESKVKGA